jgi:hypothetical protein
VRNQTKQAFVSSAWVAVMPGEIENKMEREREPVYRHWKRVPQLWSDPQSPDKSHEATVSQSGS